MWRFAIVAALAVFGLLASPVAKSEAGVAACVLGARDMEIGLLGFNYYGYAFADCSVGEDFQKGHISIELQSYDWNAERWTVIQCCWGASENNDNFVAASAAVNVPPAPPPFLGMNCRRIDALYNFTHSGRHQSFRVQSNHECY